jgi:hypothetical protein
LQETETNIVNDIQQFELNISGAPESCSESGKDFEIEVEREKRKREVWEREYEKPKHELDRHQLFAQKRGKSEERAPARKEWNDRGRG